MRRKETLKILLIMLVAVFIMLAAAALLMEGWKRSEKREQAKIAAQEAAEEAAAQAQAITPTPSPSPTPRPSVTPTPMVSRAAAFSPNDYWDYWYSTDGTVTINVYNISLESISFTFYQTDRNLTDSVSADVTAKVAGNAAQLAFSDSYGNYATGNITFTNGQLYLRLTTESPAASVYPSVNCIMSRTQVQLTPQITPTPTPAAENQSGEYILPESSSRYLTDEELSGYSSDQLELAKNEIYARHGRQFVTDYIAEYFNSKSWYQGTIDPATFDAQQDSIFNEYEIANINKIQQWEDQKASEGN